MKMHQQIVILFSQKCQSVDPNEIKYEENTVNNTMVVGGFSLISKIDFKLWTKKSMRNPSQNEDCTERPYITEHIHIEWKKKPNYET